MANNIITNHTLEQYNKKYRNLRHRLLKITKKEVEDFDKKNPTNIKGYLLKDRKWWLIGDTYYEIPKAPRYTWFRNLNGAVQAGCCLLGAGVIATAVAVPLVLMNQNKVDESSITIKGADFDKTSSHIELNKESTIVLKQKGTEEITGIEYVKVGDKQLTDTQYTFDKATKKVTIKAEAMTSTKIEIKVVIEEPIKETDKEKFIRLAHEYIYGADGFANSKKEYKKSDIQNVCLYGEEQTDFTATYETNEFGRVFTIDSPDYYYDFGTCQYYTDEKLNDMLLDAKENHTTYEFTNDYISYTTDECKEEYGAEGCLVINKFGYVTKEIYYDAEFGGWCDSYITFKNEPQEPIVHKTNLHYTYYDDGDNRVKFNGTPQSSVEAGTKSLTVNCLVTLKTNYSGRLAVYSSPDFGSESFLLASNMVDVGGDSIDFVINFSTIDLNNYDNLYILGQVLK